MYTQLQTEPNDIVHKNKTINGSNGEINRKETRDSLRSGCVCVCVCVQMFVHPVNDSIYLQDINSCSLNIFADIILLRAKVINKLSLIVLAKL